MMEPWATLRGGEPAAAELPKGHQPSPSWTADLAAGLDVLLDEHRAMLGGAMVVASTDGSGSRIAASLPAPRLVPAGAPA
jgi:hypothetical protein